MFSRLDFAVRYTFLDSRRNSSNGLNFCPVVFALSYQLYFLCLASCICSVLQVVFALSYRFYLLCLEEREDFVWDFPSCSKALACLLGGVV